MADSCATCFYYRGDACHAPFPSTIPGAAAFRPMAPEEWCGEGADDATGRSFSQSISGVPGTGGAGPGYLATSTTSLTIGSSGSKAPVTQLNLAYTAGARVRLTSSGTAAWMEGVVTSYAGDGTLTFTADLSSGAGTHTDWNINLAGEAGAATTGVASQGSFTCTATRPIVVADVAVAANSVVLLMATNAAAALCAAGQPASSTAKGIFVSALSAGVSFSVDSGDSSSFAGTETFKYVIVNP